MAVQNLEAVVIAWLNTILTDGWVAYGDVPTDNPEKYVTIDRTGGPREAMVMDRAEILIEVYHKTSRMQASDKANEIADLVPQLVNVSDNLTGARINSVVNAPNLVTQYQRYQVYCDINYRR